MSNPTSGVLPCSDRLSRCNRCHKEQHRSEHSSRSGSSSSEPEHSRCACSTDGCATCSEDGPGGRFACDHSTRGHSGVHSRCRSKRERHSCTDHCSSHHSRCRSKRELHSRGPRSSHCRSKPQLGHSRSAHSRDRHSNRTGSSSSVQERSSHSPSCSDRQTDLRQRHSRWHRSPSQQSKSSTSS